jgi:uncharacterized membrane protein YhaH (DUF805 family)
MSQPTPPGWYYAQGDPPGTQRYWDGAKWVGQPVTQPQAAPPPPSGPAGIYGAGAGPAPGYSAPPAYASYPATASVPSSNGFAFGRLFTFEGRINRQTYILSLVGFWAAFIVAGIIAAVLPVLGILLIVVIALAGIVPSIALAVRRLHDQDKSGWWYLLVFVPFGGLILLIMVLFEQGSPYGNQYGPSPTPGYNL